MGADPGRRRRARRDGDDHAAGAQRADGRRAGRGQERGAGVAGGDGGAGPGCAAVAVGRQAGRAVGVGAVRAALRGLLDARRRSSCCGSCARRWRRAIASCWRAASARRSAARTGCRCTWWSCDELAMYLGAEDRKQQHEFAGLLRDLVARGRAAGVIVCAATQKPASDVVPSRAAGPVRVPAGVAVQHAAGLGHDPRPGLGDAWAQRRRRSRPGSAASGCCWPRTARRSGCAAFTSRMRTSTSSPVARLRCALMAGWPSAGSGCRERAGAAAGAGV